MKFEIRLRNRMKVLNLVENYWPFPVYDNLMMT